ncbi:MAG TPA: metallophosphoesterase [Aggregatilinea sp.]|uniref:metallophosphoesterase n=1 Tax=Aggregatilinea sp. TaxID=2806333 RepID=UPI002C588EE6|nr:metallophosphoesterase [Aggregatilinea sp.]HML23732.1 metallophosphoesterase [Aggregatilinea sp.]
MSRSKLAGAAALLAGAAGGFVYYGRKVEPDAIDVNRLWLRLPRLDPAFEGYRLVQISDIHTGPYMGADRLNRIVDLVNEQQPNLIAITGDFVTDHEPYDEGALVAALRRFSAPDGVIAVLGNHDHRAGAEKIRVLLAESGVTDLSNQVHTLKRGDATLHLCGVDDVLARCDRLDEVVRALPADGGAILLAHEPDFADLAAQTGRFDLQLSGHSHGGQINLPVLVRVVLPPYGRKYTRGLHWVEGMILYVNRGVGMLSLPLRFRARPEITVFLLAPETTGDSLPPDAVVRL